MRKRSAFTLVELLIVIAILGILIGILLPAVNAVRQRAQAASSTAEIAQLSLACSNAQLTQGAQYFPTALYLQSTYNLANKQDAASVSALRQFFGMRFANTGQSQLQPPGMWAQPQYLNGNQCMVLFLGGYCFDQNTPGAPAWAKGYSAGVNPFNVQPVPPGQPPLPLNIYFDFKANRLYFPPGSSVPMYLDQYEPINSGSTLIGTPYFVFSDYYGVGYDQHPLNLGGSMTAQAGIYTQYATGQTGTLASQWTVSPYKDVAGKWLNVGSVQIVSGGRDNTPGPGGQWIPGQGVYYMRGPGWDDQSNFWTSTLGVSQ